LKTNLQNFAFLHWFSCWTKKAGWLFNPR